MVPLGESYPFPLQSQPLDALVPTSSSYASFLQSELLSAIASLVQTQTPKPQRLRQNRKTNEDQGLQQTSDARSQDSFSKYLRLSNVSPHALFLGDKLFEKGRKKKGFLTCINPPADAAMILRYASFLRILQLVAARQTFVLDRQPARTAEGSVLKCRGSRKHRRASYLNELVIHEIRNNSSGTCA
jgi:hypothetical protein